MVPPSATLASLFSRTVLLAGDEEHCALRSGPSFLVVYGLIRCRWVYALPGGLILPSLEQSRVVEVRCRLLSARPLATRVSLSSANDAIPPRG